MLWGRGHETLCILLPHIVIHNIFHWVFNLNRNGVSLMRLARNQMTRVRLDNNYCYIDRLSPRREVLYKALPKAQPLTLLYTILTEKLPFCMSFIERRYPLKNTASLLYTLGIRLWKISWEISTIARRDVNQKASTVVGVKILWYSYPYMP